VRSAVNCAQIATIQQVGPTGRLRPPRGESELRPIGRLDAQTMAQVDDALKFNLALSNRS
jgi:mRNA-degrading endonuclease toxin of MazEF toxin-antitoxin module